MKLRLVLFLLLPLLLTLPLLSGCGPQSDGPAAAAGPTPTGQTTEQAGSRPARVKRRVSRDLAHLLALIDTQLLPPSRTPHARPLPLDSLRRAFRRCRLAYKQVEPFSEYFMPATSRLVNGAPVPEVEAEETKMFEAAGLQVIEPLLYPEPAPVAADTASRRELLRQVVRLRRQVRALQLLWQEQEFTDAHVFDALRQQVFRVVALGITGFDTPLSPAATLPEAEATLAALEAPLRLYLEPEAGLWGQLRAARRALRHPPDFAQFDRMDFVRRHANPLGRALLARQRQLGISPFAGELRPFRPEAATLFDAEAFNPDFYTSNRQWFTNPAKVALGRQLFHDPVLSGGGGRSCASCHQPGRAFTDGQALSATLTGGTLRRNTPTLLNAGMQAAQFYDLRAPTLENQAGDVISNHDEMHGSLERAAGRLAGQSRYVAQFRRAFPQAAAAPEPLVSPIRIQNALAAYERSLLRLNSPFDRYVRGEAGARLSPAAIRGFNLYAGRARCATCHFLPLTNGTAPPAFQDSEAEVLGVPVRPGSRRLDPDPGRYALTRLPPLRHAFKTPTLRNIALTAPYMHNGQYRTLEQVLDFYNQGGGLGLGIAVANQTLPPNKLHLTRQDMADMKAFLMTLTDTTGQQHP
ncbi:cytochrome c peroxidase [Hymenobacter daecheongensis DSM 21074]|uniref:Cytochrome c peroxidase n=1 Tax=Hymenobacter daecheongensis DSM 21074 TaxID=1121955 RepID=A0A1M6LSU6_9BACT|nr:cytochrome c peroxidase [Hymenobacter daecheongensis]SHJ74249.1 cytochrome c peroxidase [Hymenobacter daecheongensis DSM 21074]